MPSQTCTVNVPINIQFNMFAINYAVIYISVYDVKAWEMQGHSTSGPRLQKVVSRTKRELESRYILGWRHHLGRGEIIEWVAIDRREEDALRKSGQH